MHVHQQQCIGGLLLVFLLSNRLWNGVEKVCHVATVIKHLGLQVMSTFVKFSSFQHCAGQPTNVGPMSNKKEIEANIAPMQRARTASCWASTRRSDSHAAPNNLSAPPPMNYTIPTSIHLLSIDSSLNQ